MPGCLPNGASEASAPLSSPCPCAAPRERPRGYGSAGDDAVGVVDRVDAAHVGEDVVELAHIAHFEREAVADDADGKGMPADADDVDARIRERAHEVLEQVIAVERLDHDLDPEGQTAETLPVHFGEALGVL